MLAVFSPADAYGKWSPTPYMLSGTQEDAMGTGWQEFGWFLVGGGLAIAMIAVAFAPVIIWHAT